MCSVRTRPTPSPPYIVRELKVYGGVEKYIGIEQHATIGCKKRSVLTMAMPFVKSSIVSALMSTCIRLYLSAHLSRVW